MGGVAAGGGVLGFGFWNEPCGGTSGVCTVWASTVLEMERMKWVVDGVEEVDGGGGVLV